MAKSKKIKDLKKLGHKEAIDTQIACGLACLALLSPEGIQQLGNLLKASKQPDQVMAHAIFVALFTVKQKLLQKGIKINPKVWIAGGGVLDRVLFEVMGVLVSVLKFPQAGQPAFVSSVKGSVLEIMKLDDQQQAAAAKQFQQEEAQQTSSKGLAAPQQGPQGAPNAPGVSAGGPPQGGLAAPQPQPNQPRQGVPQ